MRKITPPTTLLREIITPDARAPRAACSAMRVPFFGSWLWLGAGPASSGMVVPPSARARSPHTDLGFPHDHPEA